MDQLNSTTNEAIREKHRHLTLNERYVIKTLKGLGFSLRRIAKELNCSPSTVMYELRRGTGQRNGTRGRFPKYSPERGQASYAENRKRCHKPRIIEKDSPFMQWLLFRIRQNRWSIDACVAYAKSNGLFASEHIPCTKSVYNALWEGRLRLKVFDLPEALSRSHKKNRVHRNKRTFGTGIDERPADVLSREEFGHWEIDTVIGKRSGKGPVILTLAEKKSGYYMAVRISGKNPIAVIAAMETIRAEYGEEKFKEVFKTITADNGSEFAALSQLEAWGTKVYFAHPYSSWERPQNERLNRILRQFIPKGRPIDTFSEEQILTCADEINMRPRRLLDYRTPEEIFDGWLDQVYALT